MIPANPKVLRSLRSCTSCIHCSANSYQQSTGSAVVTIALSSRYEPVPRIHFNPDAIHSSPPLCNRMKQAITKDHLETRLASSVANLRICLTKVPAYDTPFGAESHIPRPPDMGPAITAANAEKGEGNRHYQPSLRGAHASLSLQDL